jgi:hypothetical protein
MRRILLFSVILVFGAACSKDQPVANLTFVAAANRMDHVDIRYISNVDLDKFSDPSKEEKAFPGVFFAHWRVIRIFLLDM